MGSSKAKMKAAWLTGRGVVRVAGPAARGFLNGLLTIDVETVAPGHPRFGALLTPQGKIVVDFFLAADGEALLFDCPRALAPALAAKLNVYKLRAKVTVKDASDDFCVAAAWDGAEAALRGLAFADPRWPALGARAVVPAGEAPALEAGPEGDYERHRIACAIPRGGVDFSYGDAFPHETDMDQLGGVDFDKGCYVGQEVISRMHHRGTARTRIVPVRFAGFAPEAGLPVLAGDRQVGMMGSGIEGLGLATLRLDRVEDALACGVPLTAGGIALGPFKPAWASFAFPSETRTVA